MGGIILYIYFLVIGFLYANELFRSKNIYFRAWMGGVFGNVILMAGIVIPSLIFDFTILSHTVLAVLAAAPYVWIAMNKKDKLSIKDRLITDNASTQVMMDTKVFVCLILPLTLVMGVLFTNHILAPYGDGAYASGQCTYGDLQMHLSFITSIAEQKSFPPEYSLLAGTKLNYPFFVDMLSSSLYLFGTPLRWAVLIPSYVISMLLAMGFYIVAYTLTKRKSAAVLATVFFFLNGGLGFAYFFEGSKADIKAFTEIFTGYYHTPTNYNEHNIRWANTICDMIIPQRTTMAGWCTVLPALWMLIEAIKTNSRRIFVVLGAFAGCMPMIHTHSFLALGLISAVMFFMYLGGKTNEERKNYLINWVIYGAIAIGMAMPQLFYWTFTQTTGNESFLRYQFNWVNHNDPYFWFYLKNWGITALFAVPAIMWADKDNKKLLAGCAFIFVLAEFILFQPNEYDNNKLFFIVYMILIMMVSGWLVSMWDKLKGVKGRGYLAAVTIIAGTLSGTLTIGREYHSGAMYQTFSKDAIAMSEYIKENTPANAVFLTGAHHTNPVCTLAGRTIYLGSSLYVYYHGMGDEYYSRKSAMEKAYKGTYEDMTKFCKENGIEYVYVGASEKNEIKPNGTMLSQLEKVHSIGAETLYKIN